MCIDDKGQKYTGVRATLGRELSGQRVQPMQKWKKLIEENSGSEDHIVFTHGSVQRRRKSGWAYTAWRHGETVKKKQEPH